MKSSRGDPGFSSLPLITCQPAGLAEALSSKRPVRKAVWRYPATSAHLYHVGEGRTLSKHTASVERVRHYLREKGLQADVQELNSSTRTARLAAQSIGVELGSIVKSLVFLADEEPVVVLVSGDRRADLDKLKSLLQTRSVMIADADRVRQETGFAIGGVPPIAHCRPLPTLIDSSLGRFGTVYAAAGSPQAIFPIEYRQLVALTSGREVDCTEVGPS
jgi:prolyl-tRNA editing enzyme YbaK/EbsC (Cys-tRNA(Pro) deacylase)